MCSFSSSNVVTQFDVSNSFDEVGNGRQESLFVSFVTLEFYHHN